MRQRRWGEGRPELSCRSARSWVAAAAAAGRRDGAVLRLCSPVDGEGHLCGRLPALLCPAAAVPKRLPGERKKRRPVVAGGARLDGTVSPLGSTRPPEGGWLSFLASGGSLWGAAGRHSPLGGLERSFSLSPIRGG